MTFVCRVAACKSAPTSGLVRARVSPWEWLWRSLQGPEAPAPAHTLALLSPRCSQGPWVTSCIVPGMLLHHPWPVRLGVSAGTGQKHPCICSASPCGVPQALVEILPEVKAEASICCCNEILNLTPSDKNLEYRVDKTGDTGRVQEAEERGTLFFSNSEILKKSNYTKAHVVSLMFRGLHV